MNKSEPMSSKEDEYTKVPLKLRYSLIFHNFFTMGLSGVMYEEK